MAWRRWPRPPASRGKAPTSSTRCQSGPWTWKSKRRGWKAGKINAISAMLKLHLVFYIVSLEQIASQTRLVAIPVKLYCLGE
jgi:hypothetical protein